MTKQLRSERTRQTLIETASELLATKGTTATTFDAIAGVCGLSRGCIRFHFGSKNGLLLAVVERVFADYEAFIETELIRRGERPSSILEVLESHRDFTRQNETIGRVFFVLLFEALGPNPDLLPHFTHLLSRLRVLAIEWIEAARADGTIAPDLDADAVACIVLSVFGGLRYHWYVERENMDLDRIYSVLHQMLVRALAPPIDLDALQQRKDIP